MTEPEKEKLLVRGLALSGSTQWTLLGTSETDAAQSVKSVRGASARLNAWSRVTIEAADKVEAVTVKRIEGESPSTTKRARQINGDSKALSPEYRQMFSCLSEDFISVERALVGSPAKPK